MTSISTLAVVTFRERRLSGGVKTMVGHSITIHDISRLGHGTLTEGTNIGHQLVCINSSSGGSHSRNIERALVVSAVLGLDLHRGNVGAIGRVPNTTLTEPI